MYFVFFCFFVKFKILIKILKEKKKIKDLHLLTIMGPYCKVLPHII